jgi:peptidoglycan hydrolase CwlO-like protein
VGGLFGEGTERTAMGLFDMLGDSLRGASKSVQKSREAAIRNSEKMLKIQRLKMDVQTKREDKEKKMTSLAHKVYELYAKNKLTDPELLSLCQDIKTLQWQIDESWTEINHLNK